MQGALHLGGLSAGHPGVVDSRRAAVLCAGVHTSGRARWRPSSTQCNGTAGPSPTPQLGRRRHGASFGGVVLGGRPVTLVRAVTHPNESLTVVEDKVLTLRNGAKVKVTVDNLNNGTQKIKFWTDLQAGRPLLHWGVEGGKDYVSGWRLPGPSCRPEGTIQYKDRALQSPLRPHDGGFVIDITLAGDEASDIINFVFKDDASNTWYDNNGSNFKLPLRPNASTEQQVKLDALPKDLCDKWAWIRWDFDGRPSRTDAVAAEEYEKSVQEMQELLRKGRLLDELWRVAEGKWKYADYRGKVIAENLGAKHPTASQGPRSAPQQQAPPQQQQSKPLPAIPEDLVGVQAYVLWEKAGKPNGADMGWDARRVIEDQLKGGLTLEQIAAKLNYKLQGSSATAAPSSPAPALSSNGKKAPPAVVGKPLETPKRNPLDLVKRAAPQLSAGKARVEEKPLDFIVQNMAVDRATKWRRVYPLGSKSELLAVVRQEHEEAPIRVDLITDNASEVVLHWGVAPPSSRDWMAPDEQLWPAGSITAGRAVESPFLHCDDDECDVEIAGAKVPLQRIVITLPPDSDVGALQFVLRSQDHTMWFKDAGGNYFVPLPGKHGEAQPSSQDQDNAASDDLSRAIIDAENTSAWTLMHRFNRAADLINEVLNGNFDMDVADAAARIYTWLRYSSTRQLTWQRNYNTQPRILSAAQERLTHAIASAHTRTTGEAQEWVRAMFTTVGRGGDGQRIRDEILHIMHRNHIPEKKGLWMEEWHQKLHNNTTPDDVPICQAYLAFLEGYGNVGAYWRVLSDAGLTRQRLESFDRPILSEPNWYPEKRDALIREFTNYLGILKAVHSGADLQASASAAGNRIPSGARGYLGYVLSHVGDAQVLPFMEAAVEARTELQSSLVGNRELLYLDLALEDEVRRAAERGVGVAGAGAAAFMKPLLQNLCLSVGDNEELCYCLKAWNSLPASVRTGGRLTKEEALLGVAVLNRIRRALADVSDNVIKRIGNVSKAYGRAFGCESWAVELFAEEVVRGGPAFAVSLLVSAVDPVMRKAAALGAWQVISPAEVTGVVEVVEGLTLVQEKVYATPTVLIAEQVSGEEEIPEGVVAVLTPDAPDVLSHVSVRARNMKVLFATCHDEAPLQQLKDAAGKTLHFTTSAAGAVSWTEGRMDGGGDGKGSLTHERPLSGLHIDVPKWSGKWAVSMDQYADGVVGAKSKNLAKMRGKLPEWIALPASVTLPFGCFEETLLMQENKEIAKQIADRVARIHGRKTGAVGGLLAKVGLGGSSGSSNGNGSAKAASVSSVDGGSSREKSPAALLAECRELAMKVVVPKVLREELAAAMKGAGIPVPQDEERWGKALQALKGVWASKYNDRAFYSMKKVGLDFDDVRMAVLVQRVVPAHYAFVIHTKNPSNNDAGEVFCELVRGLGESLVSGTVPGSAVAFKARKDNLDAPEVLCYASKSEGMFVPESLIFRSDSNGEDLEGYAGAGLYESITMDTTETRRVDYMDDPLVQDPTKRRELLSKICKVGASIETALGSAQDIEGVVEPNGAITVVQTRPQV